MFEARMQNASLLKNIVDALKDLVTEATLQCSKTGVTMQAMDSSHVSLCTLNLKSDQFAFYRCDKKISLGLSLTNLAKVLKCAGNTDSVTIRAEDDADVATFLFESDKSDKISEFEFKLMNINIETMGIPDTKYACTIKMNAKEFRTIMSDLKPLGDACAVSVTKEGVTFSVTGDTGTANVTVKQSTAVDTEDGKGGGIQCSIEMNKPVNLSFAMRYLCDFTKATALSEKVHISMSADDPLMVEYRIEEQGDIKYYLAPKLDEEANAA